MRYVALLAGAAGVHAAATVGSAVRRGHDARRTRASSEAPASWPSVSVIVPAWQEAGTIERCLRALDEVDYPSWEVLVVAGGADGTLETARAAVTDPDRVTVIRQGPRGKNAALNAGIASATGEIIVFLDADSCPRSGWLRALVTPLDVRTRAVTGRAIPIRPTAIARAEVLERISAYEVHGDVVLQGSASIAIHRDALDEIGGLPEDVAVGVDWDLDRRLTRAGIHRAYARDAIVQTERPATLPEFWHNELRWRRAHLASIVRGQAHGPKDRRRLVRDLYIYGLAWLTFTATAIGGLALTTGTRHVKVRAISLWAVGVAWLAVRRAAIVIQVAAYTGERRWLGLLPVVPGLLVVTFAAICVATVTPHRRTMHFKGPRPVDGSTP